MPENMRRLPIDDRGYPVPWFVPTVDGKPEFRAMDPEKFGIAVRLKRCWLCGQPLGVHMCFPIGPMCMVTRTIGEPPSHHACALYGVKACPFLTQPRMRRNEKDLPADAEYAEGAILRNPGVIALYTTRTYQVQRLSKSILFKLGEPERQPEYFCEGRQATHEEIMASIESGLPLLRKEAEQYDGPDGVAELTRSIGRAMTLVPQV
jgi:hypothetical protein